MTTQDFKFPDPGVPRIPIERVDLYSERAAHLAALSRPFVAKVDWPALQWTPEYLRKKIGHGTVPMLLRNGEKVKVSVNQYIDVIDNMRSGTGEYVAHNYPVIGIKGRSANPDFECLTADLRLPSFIRDDNTTDMWIWLKNAGCYDNKSHAEPNAAANLNLQVAGKKHVWLFPPDDAALIGAVSTREEMWGPPFFASEQKVYGVSDEHPEFANAHCYEAVLEAGDVIHIPTFWFHWFVHYDAYQINFNAWFYPDQIPMSPIAGEWAYMKALAVSLGGFDVAAERFAALPEETQELLAKVARTLSTEPRVTRAKGQGSLFEKAKPLELPDEMFEK